LSTRAANIRANYESDLEDRKNGIRALLNPPSLGLLSQHIGYLNTLEPAFYS
jgi:hypothetical protein